MNKDTWDVSLGNVIGREIVAIPWVGYVFFYLRTLSGFLVVTLLSLVFLIAPEVYGLVGQWPRSRAKTAS